MPALPPFLQPGLVELFITDNLLESLPPEMGQLSSLVKLQVGSRGCRQRCSSRGGKQQQQQQATTASSRD